MMLSDITPPISLSNPGISSKDNGERINFHNYLQSRRRSAGGNTPATDQRASLATVTSVDGRRFLTSARRNYRFSSLPRHHDFHFDHPALTSDLLPGANRNFGALETEPTTGAVRWDQKGEQVRTKWQKIGEKLAYLYKKSHVKGLLPVLILIGYSFAGAGIFWSIEAPNERQQIAKKVQLIDEIKNKLLDQVWDVHQNRHSMSAKLVFSKIYEPIFQYTMALNFISDRESGKRQDRREAHQIRKRIDTLSLYTQQLTARCLEIIQESNTRKNDTRKLRRALKSFESYTGLSSTLKTTWTLWNSMFLAVTTYTTIGYGNIVPTTTKGKIAAIFYSFVGIPLILTILHRLGRVFLYLLQRTWDFILWSFEACQCVKQPEKIKSKSRITLDTGTGGRESYNIPVSLAVGVTFAWMFICAAIFLKFEPDWDYFKSFYFFFISLTTIGYGDVVPTKSTDMFIIFGLIIIGLSLVSMCINVIQIKLEHLFEDLMIMMMEEYQTAQLLGESMGGPPVDIRKSFNLMQVWKVWKRRNRQNRRASDASEQSASNFLLPLLAKKQRDAFISEWKRKSKMRVKGTQTTPTCLRRSVSTQTESSIVVRNHQSLFSSPDSSPRSSPSVTRHLGSGNSNNFKVATSNYLPLPQLPETVENVNLSSENVSGEGATNATVSLVPPTGNFCARQNFESPLRRLPIQTRGATQAEIHAEEADTDSEEISEFASTSFQEPQRLYRTRQTSLGSESLRTCATMNSWAQNSSSGSSDSPLTSSWVFVSGKAPHGLPRGLVPAMFIRRQSKDVCNDDFRSLVREIDVRLKDCRDIVSNNSENDRNYSF